MYPPPHCGSIPRASARSFDRGPNGCRKHVVVLARAVRVRQKASAACTGRLAARWSPAGKGRASGALNCDNASASSEFGFKEAHNVSPTVPCPAPREFAGHRGHGALACRGGVAAPPRPFETLPQPLHQASEGLPDPDPTSPRPTQTVFHALPNRAPNPPGPSQTPPRHVRGPPGPPRLRPPQPLGYYSTPHANPSKGLSNPAPTPPRLFQIPHPNPSRPPLPRPLQAPPRSLQTLPDPTPASTSPAPIPSRRNHAEFWPIHGTSPAPTHPSLEAFPDPRSSQ